MLLNDVGTLLIAVRFRMSLMMDVIQWNFKRVSNGQGGTI